MLMRDGGRDGGADEITNYSKAVGAGGTIIVKSPSSRSMMPIFPKFFHHCQKPIIVKSRKGEKIVSRPIVLIFAQVQSVQY